MKVGDRVVIVFDSKQYKDRHGLLTRIEAGTHYVLIDGDRDETGWSRSSLVLEGYKVGDKVLCAGHPYEVEDVLVTGNSALGTLYKVGGVYHVLGDLSPAPETVEIALRYDGEHIHYRHGLEDTRVTINQAGEIAYAAFKAQDAGLGKVRPFTVGVGWVYEGKPFEVKEPKC